MRKGRPRKSHNHGVQSTQMSKKKLDPNQRIFSYKIRIRPTAAQKDAIHRLCAVNDLAYNLALRQLQQNLGTEVFDAKLISTPNQHKFHPIITNQDTLFGAPNPLKSADARLSVKREGVMELLAMVKSTTESMLTRGDRGDDSKADRYQFTMRPRAAVRPFKSFAITGSTSKASVRWDKNNATFTFFPKSGFPRPIRAASRRDFRHWLQLARGSRYTKKRRSQFTCHVKYERPGNYYLILPYVYTIPPSRTGSTATTTTNSALSLSTTPASAVRVVALDPGVRTFQTTYDNSGQVREYGTASSTSTAAGRLYALAKRADKLQSELATSARLTKAIATRHARHQFTDTVTIDADGSATTTRRYEDKIKKFRKNRRRRVRRLFHLRLRKIDNLRRDAHWKVANDLCADYDHILAPTFNVSQMVVRATRRINSETVRKMMHWGHYQFRQRLKHVALKRGVTVHDVSEAYTSKACGGCGRLHHTLGGNKVFRCRRCGYSSGRDAHGARNIMVMNVESCVGDVVVPVRADDQSGTTSSCSSGMRFF